VRAEREAREKLLAKRKLTRFCEKKMPQEQPQDVGRPRKDAKAQEDSGLQSSSEDNDQEDTKMLDASEARPDATADGQGAIVDLPDKFTGQSGRPTRKQKRGDRTKHKKRYAFAAAMQTPDWPAHTQGVGRRKKKRG
jgi:hypothetical protein